DRPLAPGPGAPTVSRPPRGGDAPRGFRQSGIADQSALAGRTAGSSSAVGRRARVCGEWGRLGGVLAPPRSPPLPLIASPLASSRQSLQPTFTVCAAPAL